MNTIEHLRELFYFNDWANRRVVNALREATSEESLRILAHILLTEKEYFERLYGKDSTGFDFWQRLTHEECKSLAMENAESFLRLLKGFDDEGLDISVNYKTSVGIEQRNTFRELLTHVLFHSMNHRGQINTILRKGGCSPIANDYIIYLRSC